MKLKFNNCRIPGKIWKLYIPVGADYCWIQFELDNSFQLVCLRFLEARLGEKIQLPEERLLLHSSSSAALVFKRFPRRDWPIAVGMASYDLNSGKFSVFEKAGPLEIFDEHHWLVNYENEGTILLNVLSGATFDAQTKGSVHNETVISYDEESTYYSDLRKFLHSQLNLSAAGSIDYSESEEGLMLGFHTSDHKTTFSSHCAFWDLEGKLLLKDDCFNNLNGQLDAIVIGNEKWLVYLKSEQEIVFVPWIQR